MGWLANGTPRPLYPRERPGTYCIGDWVGPRVGLDGCEKSLPRPGFNPRTVQPIASHYTDRVIAAYCFCRNESLIHKIAGVFNCMQYTKRVTYFNILVDSSLISVWKYTHFLKYITFRGCFIYVTNPLVARLQSTYIFSIGTAENGSKQLWRYFQCNTPYYLDETEKNHDNAGPKYEPKTSP